ncbi:MAG: hypothetical protein AAF737_04880 [Pseudomonadota bacterium]
MSTLQRAAAIVLMSSGQFSQGEVATLLGITVDSLSRDQQCEAQRLRHEK